jgi:hypothetical protein
MSEELGDLLMPSDVNMALTVYQRAKCPEKVINCLMQKGESDKIVAYSTSVGYRVDYTFMLQQLVRTNPQVGTAPTPTPAPAARWIATMHDLYGLDSLHTLHPT